MSDLRARLRLDGDAAGAVAAGASAERAVEGVRKAAGGARPQLDGMRASATGAASGLDRAAVSSDRFERSSRLAGRAGLLLGTALGAIGSARFAREITDAQLAATGLETGLNAAAGSAAAGARELAWTREEAERLGLVAQDSARSMLNLAASTRGTELAGQATRDIWLAVNEAGLVLGRTNEQIGRGFTAIEQIAGKGVVSMEEVRQQLAEAIPGAVQIAARAMDMTAAEFNKVVASGDLLATDFLPRFAAQLREEYGPAIDDYLTSPMGRARGEMALWETQLRDLRAAAGGGFLEGMTEGLGRLNDELGDAEGLERAEALGRSMGEAMGFAADVAVMLADNIDIVTTAAGVLGGVALARWMAGVSAEAARATVAATANAAANRVSAAAASQSAAAEASLAAAVAAATRQEVLKAEAVMAAAVAEQNAARVTYAKAAADAAASGSTRVRALRAAEAAAALTALRAADDAAAIAAGRLTAAQTAAAASTTALGRAAVAARGAMGGLLAMVGGPLGAALLAVGGAVMFVNDALDDQRERAATAEANIRAYESAIADADEVLRSAAEGSESFGNESDGAVGGTNALRDAVADLAAETWNLANARADAARAALSASWQELETERNNLSRSNPVQDVVGDILGSAGGQARAPALVVRNLVAPDNSARIDAIAEQQAALGARLQALYFDPASHRAEDDGGGGGGGGGGAAGRSRRDRAADVAADLALERESIETHTAALRQGEAALEAWRIAEAGRQAVAQSGLDAGTAQAEAIRQQAEAVEQLVIAEERISGAFDFAREADEDIAALRRREQALAGGRAAMEAFRVEEAALAVLRDNGVHSLEALTDAEREAIEVAMAAARARETQTIAVEKAEAAAESIEELDQRIDAERRRAVGLTQGAAAEVEYARAEAVRQELERAGLTVTDAAAAGVTAKTEALFALQAQTNLMVDQANFERELRLARMTNRERDIAVRVETLIRDLMAAQNDLSEDTARAQAEIIAGAEQSAREWAEATGDISQSLADAFIEAGDLSFEALGDGLERELRRAVYNALLAKPIDIVVQAAVGGLQGVLNQVLGGIGGLGNSGIAGKGGATGGLFGGQLGGLLGNALTGYGLGSALGLGSGNALIDGGLSLGGSALGGMAGNALTSVWASSAAAQALGFSGSAFGGLAGALAPIMGPLGALAGLALGGLFDQKGPQPYARADIVAQDGRFVHRGGQEWDDGNRSGVPDIARAIVESLNAAAGLFNLDLSKVEGLYTTVGFVQQTKRWNELKGNGYWGGDIRGNIDYWDQVGPKPSDNTWYKGVSFTEFDDPAQLAEEIVRETILRAIADGASDLTEAEQRLVLQTESLEEAITVIQRSRVFMGGLDDALAQLLDPVAFERQQALDAIEATYESLRAEAEELIAAGLVPEDAMDRVEELLLAQTTALAERLVRGASAFTEGLALELQRFTDPVGYERDRALAEIQRAYETMRAEAEALVGAGLAPESTLDDVDALRRAQVRALAAEMIASAEDFRLGLQGALDQLADPAAFEREQALAAIEQSYQAMREQAEQLIEAGLLSASAMGDLEALREARYQAEAERLLTGAGAFGRELELAILEMTDPLAYARETAIDQIDAMHAAMRAEAERLIEAGLAPLSILDDIDRLRDLRIDETLTELATSAQQASGALAEIFRAQGAMGRWMDQQRLSEFSPLNPLELRNEAFRQYEEMLARAEGGDADAIGALTEYAEALLSADRDATSSASARALLFEEVMADIRRIQGTDFQGEGDPVVTTLEELRELVENRPPYDPGPTEDAITDLAEQLMSRPVYDPQPVEDAIDALAEQLMSRPVFDTSDLEAAIDRMAQELTDAIRDLGEVTPDPDLDPSEPLPPPSPPGPGPGPGPHWPGWPFDPFTSEGRFDRMSASIVQAVESAGARQVAALEAVNAQLKGVRTGVNELSADTRLTHQTLSRAVQRTL